jgi:hypothetical protein
MASIRLPSQAEQGQVPYSVDPLFGRSGVPILLIGNGVSGPNDAAGNLLAFGRVIHAVTFIAYSRKHFLSVLTGMFGGIFQFWIFVCGAAFGL